MYFIYLFFFTTFHGSKVFKSSLAIIWLQESLTYSCSSVSFSLCYDPWVDKMFCSLGYRLRSRVALGIGIVVIMYCKFLMEYVYIKKMYFMTLISFDGSCAST